MKFDTFWKNEGLGESPGRPPPHPGRPCSPGRPPPCPECPRSCWVSI